MAIEGQEPQLLQDPRFRNAYEQDLDHRHARLLAHQNTGGLQINLEPALEDVDLHSPTKSKTKTGLRDLKLKIAPKMDITVRRRDCCGCPRWLKILIIVLLIVHFVAGIAALTIYLIDRKKDNGQPWLAHGPGQSTDSPGTATASVPIDTSSLLGIMESSSATSSATPPATVSLPSALSSANTVTSPSPLDNKYTVINGCQEHAKPSSDIHHATRLLSVSERNDADTCSSSSHSI